MSNLERLNKEAELTVLKTRVVGQRLRAENLRNGLRLELDTCKPVESLHLDNIQGLTFDFSAAHIDLNETLAMIAAINNFLGR
jgi:hypothetical protein